MKVLWLGIVLLGVTPCVSADEIEHAPTQQEIQQNKRHVYSKAILWAVIMGLIGRDFHMYTRFQCRWARDQFVIPGPSDDETFSAQTWRIIQEDVKRITLAKGISLEGRIPLTARIIFALFGFPFVVKYTYDAWREAYDTYMHQSRHSMLKPNLVDNVA
ncbi:hypothetical protein JW872_03050 [Candidatus Babeliales bacterium]|nr:hypothetical protein [Candidatus Babeliales bacterium]